ncbi:transporter substrate-binding domain-containing protein [Paenibacillus flagellatus]|uniref:Glutamine ABC transporter substrate-bindnig protein n=1 Tax=Paenibacillus flagellatus TaxID=2211139 RepID=A0A2V5K2J9_9BACL|nr:transporter substrate-binding domain-containing protein [Paenibacillus flagellatus]PYI53418.1 glutamine ABC transporter substrate-bindnig protein [Paenibacillus flagellatus]
MKRTIRRGVGIGMLAAALTLSACGRDQTVKVGIENNFRPFTYTENGENKGFEVELWDAIAKKAGMKYELVPMGQGELSQALQSGKVDLVVAGMTVNKARKDNLAFSDPYFQTGLVMLTAQDNTDIGGKDDLKGKTVATKLGSTAYTYAGGLGTPKEVVGYPDIDEAYAALASKRVDCVIFDERNAREYVQGRGQDKVKIVGEPLNKESYAIAAPKKNKHIGPINGAIEQVVKNGTYETLYAKWFGGKPNKLPGQ